MLERSTGSGEEIITHGLDIDDRPGCAHWRTPRDLIAIQFPCCGKFYACYECHNVCETHAAERWPRDTWERARAILCRACTSTFSIAEYMNADAACPHCQAVWNPGCRSHWHLYFETENPPETSRKNP